MHLEKVEKVHLGKVENVQVIRTSIAKGLNHFINHGKTNAPYAAKRNHFINHGKTNAPYAAKRDTIGDHVHGE